MKILYLISTLENCGPVCQLYNIIHYLDRSHFDPEILTLSPEPDNTLLPLFKKSRIEVKTLGLTRIQGFLKGNFTFLKIIKNINPTIIHSHSFRSDLFLSSIKGRLRIATLHSYPYGDYPAKYGIIGYLMAAQHIHALRYIPCRVTVSLVNRKKLFCHKIDFRVIPNGVDTNYFSPLREKHDLVVLKEKLGLPLGKKIFVSLGGLIYRKNPEVIIRGFMASHISSESILLMIGDGILRKKCKKISANYPGIKYLGQVLNVRDYLQAADCLLSASKSEGMPTAILEALACGIPVCLSDIPEHLEIMKYAAGNIGINFREGDSRDCAHAIDSFFKMDQGIMQLNATKIALEFLNAKNMSKKYQNLYEECLRNSII